MNNIQKTTINPNLSIVTENMPYLPSTALGIFFNNGSRYETKDIQGITHLIEHMLFKGTKTKCAKEIAYIAESAGAILDGFTSKETTGIYSRFLASEFTKILTLIIEIISESDFSGVEIEKEKNVILQEIKESEETPPDYLFSLLFEALFPNHPLSFPITGTSTTVQSMTRDDVINYYRNKYLCSKVCISAAGSIVHEQLVENLFKLHNWLTPSDSLPISSPSKNTEPTLFIKPRNDLTQVYNTFAKFTMPFKDPRRYALTVVNTIWGGSLSSRLFQKLREEEGLVYTIYSYLDFYSDIGILGIYSVIDAKNNQALVEKIIDTTNQLLKYGITKDEFDRAINYCKGNLVLGTEDPMARMMRNAKNLLLLDKIIPVEESIAAYDRLTLDDVNAILPELMPDNLFCAVVGAIEEKSIAGIKYIPQKVVIK